ncbi:MAG: hypothetical protein ACJ71Y_06770 [Blastococcus sp.]
MTDTRAGSADPTMQVIPAEECFRLLATHEISGRRIVPGELPGLDPRGYL